MAKNDAIDHEMIRKLAELLSETDLSEIEIEHETLRLRLSRNVTPAPQVIQTSAPAPFVAPHPPAPMAASEPVAPSPAAAATPPGNTLTSPMVGTAYLAPEPGKPAFVKVGDTVKAGQTVLIIEAMKTMNQIPADKDGTISAILISDAQPVEFGEPLLIIE